MTALNTGSAVAPPAPAAAPPAPAPAQPDVQSIDYDMPIEFEVGGQKVEMSLSQISEKLARASEYERLGDPDAMRTAMGFINGDPVAQRRVLEHQLKALSPQNPPPAPNATINELQKKVTTMEETLRRADRYANLLEAQEDQEYLTRVLSVDAVKQAFPFITHNPGLGTHMLQQQFSAAKQAAKKTGKEMNQQELVAMLRNGELAMRAIASSFGVTNVGAPTNARASGPFVTAERVPNPNQAFDPYTPMRNPRFDFRNMPHPDAANRPVPVGTNVPDSGNTTGLPAGGRAQSSGPMTADEFRNRIRAQVALGGQQ